MGKCNECICIQCKTLFKTDPLTCYHSDCKWCMAEETSYTERCGIFLEKGGTYGDRAKE